MRIRADQWKPQVRAQLPYRKPVNGSILIQRLTDGLFLSSFQNGSPTWNEAKEAMTFSGETVAKMASDELSAKYYPCRLIPNE